MIACDKIYLGVAATSSVSREKLMTLPGTEFITIESLLEELSLVKGSLQIPPIPVFAAFQALTAQNNIPKLYIFFLAGGHVLNSDSHILGWHSQLPFYIKFRIRMIGELLVQLEIGCSLGNKATTGAQRVLA